MPELESPSEVHFAAILLRHYILLKRYFYLTLEIVPIIKEHIFYALKIVFLEKMLFFGILLFLVQKKHKLKVQKIT